MGKSTEKTTLAATLFAIAIASQLVAIGWIWAHQTVADECKRLNGFYVGNKVFECREKSK